mmetsp:Transcript_4970/g.19885  ORF Transcript_4970/g.19885 Transcript_4970/m.19885 type:complete len:221 (+) Transcript_4970:444-1106(+)
MMRWPGRSLAMRMSSCTGFTSPNRSSWSPCGTHSKQSLYTWRVYGVSGSRRQRGSLWSFSCSSGAVPHSTSIRNTVVLASVMASSLPLSTSVKLSGSSLMGTRPRRCASTSSWMMLELSRMYTFSMATEGTSDSMMRRSALAKDTSAPTRSNTMHSSSSEITCTRSFSRSSSAGLSPCSISGSTPKRSRGTSAPMSYSRTRLIGPQLRSTEGALLPSQAS